MDNQNPNNEVTELIGDLLTELINELVVEQNFTEFQFLRNIYQRNEVKRRYVQIKFCRKLLRNSAASALKDYLNSLGKDNDQFESLVIYSDTNIIIEAFSREIGTLLNMLDEFYEYTLSGHVFDVLLGGDRADEDLRDFRNGRQAFMEQKELALTKLFRTYAELDQSPIIELLNIREEPVAAVYLNEFKYKRFVISETNNSERYAFYADGVLVYFSHFRKIQKA